MDSSGPEISVSGASRTMQKRQANLYDAVTGRVTTTEKLRTFNSRSRAGQSQDGVYRLRDSTLAPEEVLFQRRKAPQRYEEKDIYFSHETQLPHGGRDVLPESDLLKAVHGHASRFYESLGAHQPAQCFLGSRHVDERSMDETALLAFGILLEEAGREVLGRTGDLVFTEGLETAGDDDESETAGRGGALSREASVGPANGETFWRRSYPKRRKTDDGRS